jgi:heme-degrading monooxygenase HmoA
VCVSAIERAYLGSLGGAYAPADLEEKEAKVYGTVGHMKVKPGKMQDVRDNMLDPQGASAKGFRGLHFLVADEGSEAVVAVIFEDKDSYTAMVHDPKTDENFGKLMTLLEGDPSWTDGEWRSSSPA